jgi:hypothetical protein
MHDPTRTCSETRTTNRDCPAMGAMASAARGSQRYSKGIRNETPTGFRMGVTAWQRHAEIARRWGR